jgi:hypothetical protein
VIALALAIVVLAALPWALTWRRLAAVEATASRVPALKAQVVELLAGRGTPGRAPADARQEPVTGPPTQRSGARLREAIAGEEDQAETVAMAAPSRARWEP